MKKIFLTGLLVIVCNAFGITTNETVYQSIEFGDIPSSTPMYDAEIIDDIISNNTSKISIIGAKSADGNYETNNSVSTLLFDKDSGFSLIPIDNELKISLGSAWTWLFPDIEKIYTNVLDGIIYTNSALRPSGEESISIKVVYTNETGTFWGPNTNKNEKTFYIGLGEVPFERVYVTSDIVITNIPNAIGRYKNGDTITNGTHLDKIFNSMFRGYVTPTYTQPKFEFSTVPIISQNSIYEFMTNMTPLATSKLTTNDAGNPTNYEFYFNGVLVSNIASTALAVNYQYDQFELDATKTLKSKVFYEAGLPKKDSDGNIYTNGMILASSKEIILSVKPSRFAFFGIHTGFPVIREFTRETIIQQFAQNKPFVANLGTSYTMDIPINTTQIVFAFPKEQKSLNKIQYYSIKTGMQDITSDNKIFEIENFNCLNGYSGNEDNGQTYIIYSYEMQSAISESGASIIYTFN